MPGRIFIVDDEKIIADTLCAILHNSGYDALPFYDAASTLTACAEQHPDFVITDVSMPGMSGVELAVQLKERFPLCGVLLFSGQAGTAELLHAARQRGYEFDLLAKPIHPKDLLAKLVGVARRPPQPDPVRWDSNELTG